MLYDPSTEAAAGELPAGVVDRLELELAVGDREAALDILFRGRDAPRRAGRGAQGAARLEGRVAAIHTVSRELAAEIGGAVELGRLAEIGVPVLLVSAGESPDYMKSDTRAIADALPNAHVVALEGQDHVGDVLAPEVFAEAVIPFLRGSLPGP